MSALLDIALSVLADCEKGDVVSIQRPAGIAKLPEQIRQSATNEEGKPSKQPDPDFAFHHGEAQEDSVEGRRAFVVATLRDYPNIKRTFHSDGKDRDGIVIMTVGIRQGERILSCDLAIPTPNYDWRAILELLNATPGGNG